MPYRWRKTGLPFASKVHVQDAGGHIVGVGHMCGHDLHMSALVATGAVMAHSRDAWRGTLVLIAQPAEETIVGAAAMVRDGLFVRFPRPDAILALHVGNDLAAGTVGVASGLYSSNADSVRITIFGKGGHGSAPHTAIDPIVIAARTVLTLQTIAAREIKPGEFAVVTVGYLNAGTKNNIIPDQAELGLDRAHVQAGGSKAGPGSHHSDRERRGAGGWRSARTPHRAFRIGGCGVQRSGIDATNAGCTRASALAESCRHAGAHYGLGGFLGIYRAGDAGSFSAWVAPIHRSSRRRRRAVPAALQSFITVRAGRRSFASYGHQSRGGHAEGPDGAEHGSRVRPRFPISMR